MTGRTRGPRPFRVFFIDSARLTESSILRVALTRAPCAAPIERKVLPAEEQALKPVEVAQAELAPAEQYALGGLEAAQAYLVPAEDAVQSVLYPLETAALSELITAQEALNPYEGVALNEVGPAISFLEKNTFNALKKAQAAALPVEKVVLGGLEAAQAYSLPYEEVVVGVVPLVVKEVALFGENTAYPLILDVQSYSLPVEEAALGVLDIAAGAIVPAVEPIGAAAVKPATTLQEAALPVETAAGTPALGALTTTGEAVASFLDVQNIGH